MWKWTARALTVAAIVLLVAAWVLRETGAPKGIWVPVGWGFILAVILGTVASVGRAIADRHDRQSPTRPPTT